jgi:hypothetical protein
MFRNRSIIALLGISVLAVWSTASDAALCSNAQKLRGCFNKASSGTSSCYCPKTGTVIVQETTSGVSVGDTLGFRVCPPNLQDQQGLARTAPAGSVMCHNPAGPFPIGVNIAEVTVGDDIRCFSNSATLTRADRQGGNEFGVTIVTDALTDTIEGDRNTAILNNVCTRGNGALWMAEAYFPHKALMTGTHPMKNGDTFSAVGDCVVDPQTVEFDQQTLTFASENYACELVQ